MTYGLPTEVSAKMPYQPSIDEVWYVDEKHTFKIERWKIEYYSEMIKDSMVNPVEYAEGYLSLILQLLNDPSVWNGFTENQQFEMKAGMLCDFSLASYIQPAREIRPSLFVYHSKQKDGRYRFQQFEIGKKGIWETLQKVFTYMDLKDESYGRIYENQAGFLWGRDELVRQMQECAHKLMDMGMDEDEIRENLFQSEKLKELVVTQKGELVLNSPREKFIMMEGVKLAPLDRAVYLLFLRHPEGINFSYLPDYREELMEIYKKLMNYRTTASMLKSVEDVTDPLKNSINEKCARIRRAFTDVVGNYMDSKYCITGNRGETKTIVLDRAYVRWEKDGIISEK